jgi:GxxExxY protein
MKAQRGELMYPELSYKIVGAAMEVHKHLGNGFLEAIYDEALAMELSALNIPFEYQKDLKVFYRGKPLKHTYRADFVVDGKIIVENKASSGLTNNDRAQMINYLKATGYRLGILINYGSPSLQYERLIL